MYLGVDIGGTKTLLAVFDTHGKCLETLKFPTPQNYKEFLTQLAANVAKLSTTDFQAAGVAAPGTIDRTNGHLISAGNLGWKDISLQADLEKVLACPVLVENDAKLAGLHEAKLIKDEFNKVVYLTISTGIGIALIVNGIIDTNLGDRGGRAIELEHDGKLMSWEDFASGKAITKKYGKMASEIEDPAIWKAITHDLAVGIIDVIALLEPEVIIIGGGVGANFEKFEQPLVEYLKKLETPFNPIPPIRKAQHAEEAVIYGCFELLKGHYGNTAKKS